MSDLKPQCLKCKHYFATYDPHTPRGCRVYGFRTASMPSMVVLRETGSECLKYEPRKANDKKAKSLSDDHYWKK